MNRDIILLVYKERVYFKKERSLFTETSTRMTSDESKKGDRGFSLKRMGIRAFVGSVSSTRYEYSFIQVRPLILYYLLSEYLRAYVNFIC
jgi:hypothetical protein